MFLARPWIVLSTLAVLASWSPRPVVAEGLPTNDGPVHVIISLDPHTFSIDWGDAESERSPSGSQTIILTIGSLTGATGPDAARFIAMSIPPFMLPVGFQLSDLEGAQFTIVGSFQTTGNDPVAHLVTPMPVPDGIPNDVEQSVFFATHGGALDGFETNYPTTLEIVKAIYDGRPEGSTVTEQSIYDNVFNTNKTLSFANGVVSSEGELFPHSVFEPPATPIMNYSLSFATNEDGEVETSSDVCKIVTIDVKPKHGCHANLANDVRIDKKKGKLKVAILTTSTFDASEVDGSTASIGGVYAVDSDLKDVNGDGHKDMVLTFKVKQLADAGVLGSSTTSLTLRAELTDGTCVEGTDSVHPITSSKKGHHDDDDDEDDDD